MANMYAIYDKKITFVTFLFFEPMSMLHHITVAPEMTDTFSLTQDTFVAPLSETT